MNFYFIKKLWTESKNIWKNLNNDDDIIITNNGKTKVLNIDIANNNLKNLIKIKAILAFNAMRSRAVKQGFMSDTDINREISLVRESKK